MSDVKALYWAAVQAEIRAVFDDPNGPMAEAAWQAVNESLTEPVKSGLFAVAERAWGEGYEGGVDDTYKDLRGIASDPGHDERAENPYRATA